MDDHLWNPNPLRNPNPKILAYYQTRAVHHDIVTSDWLAQATIGHHPNDLQLFKAKDSKKPFNFIYKLNI